MDVSIIIVNYNTLELTSNCINSIIKHTKGVDYEIIVVDNNSTDDSYFELSKNKDIILIRNKNNLGFGVANNIGYSIAKGDYIFLLNSDTLLLNNAIKIFHDRLTNMDANIACIGCILKDIQGCDTYSYGKFLSIRNLLTSLIGKVFNRRKEPGSQLKRTPYFYVDVILGADLFIRRSVLNELDDLIFDPNFFMYHEENDFQKRLNSKNYFCAIIDGPSIIHYGGASDIFNKSYQYNIRSQYYYINKWYGKNYCYFYKFLFLLTQTLKILLSNKSFNIKKDKLYMLYHTC